MLTDCAALDLRKAHPLFSYLYIREGNNSQSIDQLRIAIGGHSTLLSDNIAAPDVSGNIGALSCVGSHLAIECESLVHSVAHWQRC